MNTSRSTNQSANQQARNTNQTGGLNPLPGSVISGQEGSNLRWGSNIEGRSDIIIHG